jgi:hypothetical protein
MELSIMNYACTELIETGTVKGYYPGDPRDSSKSDASDVDCGQSAIIIEPVSRDDAYQGTHGSVRVILPSGVRVVDSLSVGVWVHDSA